MSTDHVTQEQATAEELWQRTHGAGGTRTVIVKFPFNDYRTPKGIKTYEPVRNLKLQRDKHGLFVQFNGLKWDIVEVSALVLNREGSAPYRCLMVDKIQARDESRIKREKVAALRGEADECAAYGRHAEATRLRVKANKLGGWV